MKLLLYLTNIDSEFWTVKEWIKKEFEYKEFEYDLLNSIIEDFISKQKDISRSKALKYLLIQSRLLLHIENKAKIVTEEFSKAIKDSNNIRIMEVIDSQLDEFINLSKDCKSEAMRDAYFLRAKILRQKRKFNEAKKLFQKIIQFPQEDEIKGEAYQLLGYILYKEDDNKKDANNYLLSSLKLLDNDDFLKSKSYAMLGNIYKRSNFYKAKEYFLQSMEIKKKINDKEGQSQLLHDIGILYLYHPQSKKYFSEAKKYFLQSMEIKKKINDKKGQAQVLLDIGILYARVKKVFDTAKESFDKSLKIEREIGNKRGEARVLYEIGKLYEYLKYDIKIAEKYYQKSLAIEKEVGNKKGQKLVEKSLNKLGL